MTKNSFFKTSTMFIHIKICSNQRKGLKQPKSIHIWSCVNLNPSMQILVKNSPAIVFASVRGSPSMSPLEQLLTTNSPSFSVGETTFNYYGSFLSGGSSPWQSSNSGVICVGSWKSPLHSMAIVSQQQNQLFLIWAIVLSSGLLSNRPLLNWTNTFQ